jgi:hypothetical protein
MAALPPVFQVVDAMIACGVSNAIVYLGDTEAERIAEGILNDDFMSCMDKTFEEIDSDLKTYSSLARTRGQISLLPGMKRNLKAFVQWTRDEVRLGRNPTEIPFPVANASVLLRRYKTHEQFLKKSKTIAEAAKPEKFSSETKWMDWAPTLLNYLRLIPGRDGVPLKYICRENDRPNPLPQPDFLDDYVNMAPLNGEAFTIDAAEVHTLIVSFIVGNSTAEAKIQQYERNKNGRLDYIALRDHYEGIGVLAVDVTMAEATLRTLFYSGEKKPIMWWDEFEKRLTSAFTAYDKHENRNVHSNAMKLRILIEKVNADFLGHTKAGISIELTRNPMTMTYEQALAAFRNEVNRKHPPQMTSVTRTRRNINEISRGGSRGGRNSNNRGGRGGRFGRGSRPPLKKTRTDSTIITLTDGQQYEYHPSFNFPPHIFKKMKQQDMDKLKRERADYNKNKNTQSQIQELQRQLNQQSNQGTEVPDNVSLGQTSRVSQVSQGTMMGGRNEQMLNKKK